MTLVAKKEPGKVRITVDMRALNKVTVRPIRTMLSPLQVVAQVPPTAKFFTVVGGLKGFHQLELHPDSRPLTTFVTPLGRFRYRRMPMGWNASSDLFHGRMATALQGVPNVLRVVEDMLVWSETWQEHEEAVGKLFAACDAHGVSLNVDKIQFGLQEVHFGGFVVSQGKYKIDPALTDDLRQFPTPHNRRTLRSFLGLAQQLGNFTEEITALVEPLRELNTDATAWAWWPVHQAAFDRTREVLSSPKYLTFFDSSRDTELHCDASRTFGLGFMLRQRCEDGVWQTVQAGSRSLAKHERNWAGSCEIEALAVAWVARKCTYFLDGHRHFTVVTDNNPLVAVLNDRRLDQLANDRLLKMKIALMRYNFTARAEKGSRHFAPDALSRSPRHPPARDDMLLTPEEDAEAAFIVAMDAGEMLAQEIPSVDTQDARLNEIRRVGRADEVYTALAKQVQDGWPASKAVLEQQAPALTPYFRHREALRWADGLLLHGARLVIPRALVPATVRQVHAAHQGEEKSLERARHVVWWPTLANDVVQVVRRCQPCQEHRPAHAHEPLQRNPNADRPFQKVHADFFEVAGRHYLVMTDEFSGCPMLYDVGQDTTAHMVTRCLRQWFVQWGVPTVLRSDNGPQFAATQTQAFLQQWGVTFDPSSPRLPYTNGRAEAAVKAMKRLVRGATPFSAQRHSAPRGHPRACLTPMGVRRRRSRP
jgi:transposase InsO family protein